MRQQGIAALCSDELDNPELTAELLHTELVVRTQRAALHELVEALTEYAGRPVQIVLIKGISMARHWPDPLRRPASDIDIYTGEDWDIVEQWARKNATHIEGEDSEGKHTAWDWRGVHFEHHRRYLDGSPAERPVEQWLEAQPTVRYKKIDLQRLNPEAERVFCLMHMARHFEEYESIQIRHLLDWWYLMREQQVDASLVLEQLGLTRFAALMTRTAEELCGEPALGPMADWLHRQDIPLQDIERTLVDIFLPKKNRSAGLKDKPVNLYYLLRNRWKFAYIPTQFSDRLRQSLHLRP